MRLEDPIEAELTVEIDTAASAKKAVKRTSSASCTRMGIRMTSYSESLCCAVGFFEIWQNGTVGPSASSPPLPPPSGHYSTSRSGQCEVLAAAAGSFEAIRSCRYFFPAASATARAASSCDSVESSPGLA